MPTNFYMLFVAALIPMAVGFAYYHPMLMGNAWMKSNGFTTKDLEGGNMAVIFGVSYVFSVMLATMLSTFVIHQTDIVSTLMHAPNEWTAEAKEQIAALMEQYGDRYRTFGHGAVHGFLISLFVALPIIGTNALFERRGWKYILIHWGYWAITLILMGGLLCSTLEYALPS